MEKTIWGTCVKFSKAAILFTLIIIVLSRFYLEDQWPNGSSFEYALAAIGSSILIVASFVIHEIGHLVFFRRFGVGGKKVEWDLAIKVSIDPEGYQKLKLSKQLAIRLSGPTAGFAFGMVLAIPVLMLPDSLLETSFQFASLFVLLSNLVQTIPFLWNDGWVTLISLIRVKISNDEDRGWTALACLFFSIGLWIWTILRGFPWLITFLQEL